MPRKPSPSAAPITTTVVRRIEPMDLEAFLDVYARAIVEAKGTGPTGPRPIHHASTEAARP